IDAGLLTPQKDLIEGTASPDNIVGTSTDETIAGYKGQDTLTGGSGKDSFFYNETSDGVDIITDFSSGEDQIILTQILTEELNYTGNNPIADGYVVIEDYGAVGTMIQIDFDTTNDLLPKDVVFLQGVSNLDANAENDFASQTDLAF
ncbi:MAG: M10 family metallopeptidase C-terminal domain-containing protein, partial [Waterburya sp.]